MRTCTPTGGSIKNHFMLGESKDQLLQRAAARCKKISPNSKVVNFRTTRQGAFIKGEMSEFAYDCEDSAAQKRVELASMINDVNQNLDLVSFF